MRKKTVDQTDIRILNILQSNAEITNHDLSKRVGLSPGPTLTRVKKLRKNSVIKKTIVVVDEEVLGYKFKTYIMVSTKDSDMNSLIQALRSNISIVRISQLKPGTVLDNISKLMVVAYDKSEDVFVSNFKKMKESLSFEIDITLFPIEKEIEPITKLMLTSEDTVR